jgi:hypothetical protein
MGAQTVVDRTQFRSVLATIAARAKERLPQSNGRVERAAALVLSGDIAYHSEDGSALVGSCTDPTKTYHVKGGTCDCQDWGRAPDHRCKHVIGLMMLIRLQQALAAEAPQEPVEAPTPAKPARGVASSLPEARASLNFKAQVGHYEVMVTLRGDTEAELFKRLQQAVLARPDVRPLPKPAPRGNGQQWKQRTYQGR